MHHPDYPFFDFTDNVLADDDGGKAGGGESVKPPQSNRRGGNAGGGESVKPPQSNRRKELIPANLA